MYLTLCITLYIPFVIDAYSLSLQTFVSLENIEHVPLGTRTLLRTTLPDQCIYAGYSTVFTAGTCSLPIYCGRPKIQPYKISLFGTTYYLCLPQHDPANDMDKWQTFEIFRLYSEVFSSLDSRRGDDFNIPQEQFGILYYLHNSTGYYRLSPICVSYLPEVDPQTGEINVGNSLGGASSNYNYVKLSMSICLSGPYLKPFDDLFVQIGGDCLHHCKYFFQRDTGFVSTGPRHMLTDNEFCSCINVLPVTTTTWDLSFHFGSFIAAGFRSVLRIIFLDLLWILENVVQSLLSGYNVPLLLAFFIAYYIHCVSFLLACFYAFITYFVLSFFIVNLVP